MLAIAHSLPTLSFQRLGAVLHGLLDRHGSKDSAHVPYLSCVHSTVVNDFTSERLLDELQRAHVDVDKEAQDCISRLSEVVHPIRYSAVAITPDELGCEGEPRVAEVVRPSRLKMRSLQHLTDYRWELQRLVPHFAPYFAMTHGCKDLKAVFCMEPIVNELGVERYFYIETKDGSTTLSTCHDLFRVGPDTQILFWLHRVTA